MDSTIKEQNGFKESAKAKVKKGYGKKMRLKELEEENNPSTS